MVNNALVEHYKLFLLTVETFAPLQLVASKFALTDKKKAEVARQRRDGGIVKS